MSYCELSMILFVWDSLMQFPSRSCRSLYFMEKVFFNSSFKHIYPFRKSHLYELQLPLLSSHIRSYLGKLLSAFFCLWRKGMINPTTDFCSGILLEIQCQEISDNCRKATFLDLEKENQELKNKIAQVSRYSQVH